MNACCRSLLVEKQRHKSVYSFTQKDESVAEGLKMISNVRSYSETLLIYLRSGDEFNACEGTSLRSRSFFLFRGL